MTKKFSELSNGIDPKLKNEARIALLYQTKAGPEAAQSYRQYTPEILPAPPAILRKPEIQEALREAVEELDEWEGSLD